MSLPKITPNALFKSDCLLLLERLSDDSATLVYLDPPFFTGKYGFSEATNEKNKSAAFDRYLDWLSQVINQAYRITKANGNIVIHTEPRINSYIRLIAEDLFGEIEFTEIILRRPKRLLHSHKPTEEHESLLFCRKSNESIWNPPTRPLTTEEIKTRYRTEDGQGRRFNLTVLTRAAEHPSLTYTWKGFNPPVGHSWKFSQEVMERLYSEGRIQIPNDGKRPYLKSYADEASEVSIGTTWDDLPAFVHPASLEKTDYVAQQPIILMERVIQVSTNEGDLVIDPFFGSGTTLVAAHSLNRQWIGGDSSELASEITQKRLEKAGAKPPTSYILGNEKDLHQVQVVQNSNSPVFLNVLRQRKIRFIRNEIVHLEETRHYEFKEIKGKNPVGSIENTADEYSVAFLNSEGGRIYWGIRNEDRVILGITLSYRERDEVGKAIDTKLSQIQPSIAPSSWRVEFHQVYDEKNRAISDLFVVELIVPRSSQPTILHGTGKGEVFVKTNSGKKKLSFTEMQAELLKRQISQT